MGSAGRESGSDAACGKDSTSLSRNRLNPGIEHGGKKSVQNLIRRDIWGARAQPKIWAQSPALFQAKREPKALSDTAPWLGV